MNDFFHRRLRNACHLRLNFSHIFRAINVIDKPTHMNSSMWAHAKTVFSKDPKLGRVAEVLGQRRATIFMNYARLVI